MTNYETIDLTIEDKLATLTISREKQLNALNQQTLEEIEQAVESLLTKDVRVLIVTGAGEKAFVAGADIKEMKDKNAMEARAFSELGNRVFRRIDTLPFPVIAAVNGYVLGGGLELAMACDIRFASTKAKAGLPEVSLGVIPGFGGTQRLSRIVGLPKALEWTYSGETLSAQTCLEVGLFNRVVEHEELLSVAKDYAKSVISKGPIAVSLAKEAVKTGYEMTLEQGLSLESELFALSFSTEDQTEGMSAFTEKRAPIFKNI